MTSEQLFRLLLRVYPRAYRAERGPELLDVLLAAEAGRGLRWRCLEAAALVRHGLGLRLRRVTPGSELTEPAGVAGASLLCLLGVLGSYQLLAAGVRRLGLDGFSDPWSVGVLWVDPRWPVQGLWLLTGVALLLGRHRLTVLGVWLAGSMGVWLLAAMSISTVDLPWPGDVGPHWVAPGGAREAAWTAASLAAAALVGGPRRLATARAVIPSRHWWSAGVAGILGAALVSLAGGAVYERHAYGFMAILEVVPEPALPVLLTASVLAVGLVRAPHGHWALVMLGLVALAPLTVRWNPTMTLLACGTLVFAAGYAAARLPAGEGCRR